jgi:hypothetical protein
MLLEDATLDALVNDGRLGAAGGAAMGWWDNVVRCARSRISYRVCACVVHKCMVGAKFCVYVLLSMSISVHESST